MVCRRLVLGSYRREGVAVLVEANGGDRKEGLVINRQIPPVFVGPVSSLRQLVGQLRFNIIRPPHELKLYLIKRSIGSYNIRPLRIPEVVFPRAITACLQTADEQGLSCLRYVHRKPSGSQRNSGGVS